MLIESSLFIHYYPVFLHFWVLCVCVLRIKYWVVIFFMSLAAGKKLTMWSFSTAIIESVWFSLNRSEHTVHILLACSPKPQTQSEQHLLEVSHRSLHGFWAKGNISHATIHYNLGVSLTTNHHVCVCVCLCVTCLVLLGLVIGVSVVGFTAVHITHTLK